VKKTVLKVAGKSNRKPLKHARKADILENKFESTQGPINTQHSLISMMLPPAVKMFIEDLEKEVTVLCGDRYRHTAEPHQRWGSQKGSIVLGDQHVAIERPRVRSTVTGTEVQLKAYEDYQDPKLFESQVFAEGRKKVSQRDYENRLPKIASNFGFKKSSVSRKWIKATAKKLDELQTRSLTELDIRAVFIDGKRFHKQGVIIALGPQPFRLVQRQVIVSILRND
jgi:hypothetical protein